VELKWFFEDGEVINPGQKIVKIKGKAR